MNKLDDLNNLALTISLSIPELKTQGINWNFNKKLFCYKSFYEKFKLQNPEFLDFDIEKTEDYYCIDIVIFDSWDIETKTIILYGDSIREITFCELLFRINERLIDFLIEYKNINIFEKCRFIGLSNLNEPKDCYKLYCHGIRCKFLKKRIATIWKL